MVHPAIGLLHESLVRDTIPLHMAIGLTMLALAGVHVAATLRHQYRLHRLRDGLFARMSLHNCQAIPPVQGGHANMVKGVAGCELGPAAQR